MLVTLSAISLVPLLTSISRWLEMLTPGQHKHSHTTTPVETGTVYRVKRSYRVFQNPDSTQSSMAYDAFTAISMQPFQNK